MAAQSSISLIIQDVFQAYLGHRTQGKRRQDSILEVFSRYRYELEDPDDKFAVYIGITYALCKHRELFADFSRRFQEFLSIAEESEFPQSLSSHISKCQAFMDDPSYYGDEAVFKPRKIYDPGWQIGDTFLHKITCPPSQPLGLDGQFILLSVAEKDYTDTARPRYLLYAAIIPDPEILTSAQGRQSIRFVGTMQRDHGWNYYFQVVIRSKAYVHSLDLTPVGLFSDFPLPTDHVPEDPQVTMPLFGPLKKSSPFPWYEPHICRLFAQYQKSI